MNDTVESYFNFITYMQIKKWKYTVHENDNVAAIMNISGHASSNEFTNHQQVCCF